MVDSHDAETYSAKDSRLIWIDCEMTGLDIFGGDELVEVSVVPTDFDLNVLDEGVDYVIKPSDAAVAHMNDFVRAMHTRSGLINEWEHGLSLEEAERKVTEYVLRFTPDGVRPLLAGNTIGYRASDNAASSGQASQSGTDGTSDGQTSSGSTGAQQTQNGHVSSDIMDTSGTEFRVAGIVDTGGSEDSIIYALAGDVDKLTGSTRGVDVIEYSSGASDLTALVNSINDMTSMHVKAQQVTKITASDTRVITMLQTLFWIVSLVVLVFTLVGVGTTISSIVSQRRNEIGLRKALGASSHAIGVEFYVESAVYGLLGGLLGTATGYGMARWLCATVFERSIGFNWWLAVVSVVFSALVAVVASIPPVHRATRIDPAVVLREE